MDKDLESVEAFLNAEKVLSRDPLDFDDANNNRIDDRLEESVQSELARTNPSDQSKSVHP